MGKIIARTHLVKLFFLQNTSDSTENQSQKTNSIEVDRIVHPIKVLSDEKITPVQSAEQEWLAHTSDYVITEFRSKTEQNSSKNVKQLEF